MVARTEGSVIRAHFESLNAKPRRDGIAAWEDGRGGDNLGSSDARTRYIHGDPERRGGILGSPIRSGWRMDDQKAPTAAELKTDGRKSRRASAR